MIHAETRRLACDTNRFCLDHPRLAATACFPDGIDVDLVRYWDTGRFEQLMAGAGFTQITEKVTEHRYPLTDVSAYRDKSFSVLHQIPEDAFRSGLSRLKQDVSDRRVMCVLRYHIITVRSHG